LKLIDDLRQCVVFLGWQEAGPADVAAMLQRELDFLLVMPEVKSA